jgi:hypothetical protein
MHLRGSPAGIACLGGQPPLLKFTFTLAYVGLAPFVGAWADAVRKGCLMLAMNLVKVRCCLQSRCPFATVDVPMARA